MSLRNRAVAFFLTCCMVFTIFPMYALADDVRTYTSLNDIPEDVDVFRSIRTGDISTIWINGDVYYQFDQQGFPRVRIKASAFMNYPNNNYLDADNAALSVNCQNDGGASRVCYYKEMSTDKNPYSGESIYTFSMYRLELSVNVNKGEGVLETAAKLTSGVTFNYYPSMMPRYALQRVDKLPLRASIAANSYCVSQDVSLLSYITKVYGVASEISDTSKLELGASTVGCAGSILGLIAALDPEGFSKIGLAAAAFGTASSCPSPIIAMFKPNTNSPMETEQNCVYRCGAPVVAPAKLAYSENKMSTVFKINCRNFAKDDTRFMIVFSFSNK